MTVPGINTTPWAGTRSLLRGRVQTESTSQPETWCAERAGALAMRGNEGGKRLSYLHIIKIINPHLTIEIDYTDYRELNIDELEKDIKNNDENDDLFDIEINENYTSKKIFTKGERNQIKNK